MKKIATFLALLCVINALALAGLVGFLMATGRLDKTKAQSIADLLRHQGTPKKLRLQLADILEPATMPATAPATGPASQFPPLANQTDAGPATAEERIDFARQVMEQRRLVLDNEAQDLRHQHELLVQMKEDVETKAKKIIADKKAFEESIAKTGTKSDEESFQKTMALYDELKPKQIKDLFMGMPVELVARYMGAMAPDQAAKIIGEFKTPPERTFISSVLDRLRTAGTDSALGTSTANSQR